MIAWEKLLLCARMQSQEDIKDFEEGVWDWGSIHNEEHLINLLSLFDDSCEFPEVMYSLVHAVESFPPKMYVKVLLKTAARALQSYPFWYRGLIAAVFNDPSYYEIFRQNLHLAPREALLELFDLMDRESPHHKELIAQLREEVLNRPKV